MPRERQRRRNREVIAAARRPREHGPDRRAGRAAERAAARDARRHEVQEALRGGNGQENIPPPPPQLNTVETQTDDCGSQRPLVAWIVGSSIPYWAEQRARYRCPRSSANLGFDEREIIVEWFTRRGMVWDEVRPLLTCAFQEAPYIPDAVIIHCGGNSLLKQKKARFVSKIYFDLKKLRKLSGLATTLVWSSILPRLDWRTSRSVQKIEKLRKDVNRSAARISLKHGCAWIRNKEITMDCPGLFRSDGVHLSDIGLDILLSSFKEAIEILEYLIEASSISMP